MFEIDATSTAQWLWDTARPYVIPALSLAIAWAVGKAQQQGGPLPMLARLLRLKK